MDWFVLSAWAANSAVALIVGVSSSIVYRLLGAKNRTEAGYIVFAVATGWGVAVTIATIWLHGEDGTIARRFINTAAIVYVAVLIILRTRQLDHEDKIRSQSARRAADAERPSS